MIKKIKIRDMLRKSRQGQKLTTLTAYDYALASILDRAGVDIILVGDSLANVVLGLDSTRQVNIDVMLHHAQAVRRGVKRALLIGDMPYASCHRGAACAVKDSRRFILEAGCDGVKIEWFNGCLSILKKILAVGIPVMGHVGLTPQTADRLGGMKVQGRDAKAAAKIIEQAQALEKIGCFSIVLECIPDRVAGLITRQLKIPTISCGAGPLCDGQVLVTYDLLGLFDRFHPKFVKQYVNLGAHIEHAVQQYCQDVRAGRFPKATHSYPIGDEEWLRLTKKEKKR